MVSSILSKKLSHSPRRRQGGERNAQKSNQDRQQSAQDQLAAATRERDAKENGSR
jgi:hypothetical protein